ncbi:hypothetical protein C2G38_2192440 [Gigaspora rosea]|uniref:Uncharacterized protein n=1 Tax=Gigaspora rosea TaxID=44941 RepID=A0A397UYT2_9GLOM|nr:hypothetical protein C2G38_2192440 [Gigaspora rosea]
MDDLYLPINCNNRSSIIWCPLLPNFQCIQVPLTEIPSVLNLYIFDTILSGGGRLGEGGFLLFPIKVREEDVKKLYFKKLVGEYLSVESYVGEVIVSEIIRTRRIHGMLCSGKCDWKGHISVLQDKSLNLCNIECHGYHDPDHIRKKPLCISNSIRKTITNRTSKLMNNSKVLSTTLDTLSNQVQPTSTRFVPNFESIQNALKYNKKLYYPSISDFDNLALFLLDLPAVHKGVQTKLSNLYNRLQPGYHKDAQEGLLH